MRLSCSFSILLFGLAVSLASTPTLAQPKDAVPAATSQQEQMRKQAGWLLGTWTNPRHGGTIIFTVEADGSVSGKIGTLNRRMADKKYRAGQQVFRGYRNPGRGDGRSDPWDFWLKQGEIWSESWASYVTSKWENGGAVYIPRGKNHLRFSIVLESNLGDSLGWQKIGPLPPPPSEAESTGQAGSNPEAKATETIDTAIEADCVEGYIAALQGEGNRMIEAFANGTRTLAFRDPEFITAKRFPYKPANVGFDEDTQIRGFEKLANEAIRNGGPDDWLKNQRNDIIVFLKLRSAELVQMSRETGTCPGPHAQTNAASLLAQAISEINQPRLRDLRLQHGEAQSLREKYTKSFYQKVNSVGSISDKADQAWENLGYDRADLAALTPQLDRLRQKYDQAKKDGKPVSEKQIQEDIEAAFKAAGVPYNQRKAEAAMLSGLQGSIASTFNTVLDELVHGGKGSGVGMIQPVTSALMSTLEVFNAMFDFGTLNNAEKLDMPLALTLTEDTAHLQVMIQRYEKFYQDYDAFITRYHKLIEASRKTSKAM